MKITPTVGCVVWFYPASNAQHADFSRAPSGDPLAAIVALVVADDLVNLAVFDAQGHAHARINVPLLQEGEDAPDGGYYATWMPYQIGQAKKAEDREHDTKQLAVAADRASDDRRMRAGVLDMALRTPGLSGHHDVLKAAEMYQEHIAGEKTTTASSEREQAMAELLRSACAIADRKGAETAWERFANSIRELGLNGVTARTYRILPSDEQ